MHKALKSIGHLELQKSRSTKNIKLDSTLRIKSHQVATGCWDSSKLVRVDLQKAKCKIDSSSSSLSFYYSSICGKHDSFTSHLEMVSSTF